MATLLLIYSAILACVSLSADDYSVALALHAHRYVFNFVQVIQAVYICCVSGQVPIIRCPRGNAAEMVSEKLDKKLRENLRDARNSLFTGDTLQTGQIR